MNQNFQKQVISISAIRSETDQTNRLRINLYCCRRCRCGYRLIDDHTMPANETISMSVNDEDAFMFFFLENKIETYTRSSSNL